MDFSNLAERADRLLANGRYTTLATSDGSTAWAATVNYVALRDPLRLLWTSMSAARHSANIAANPTLSGTIHMTGLPAFPVDGLQYEATARSAEDSEEAEQLHQQFHELTFPDETVSKEWALPLDECVGPGLRRFYVADITRYWLLDIDRWLIDQTDARIEVDIETRS
jgi:uncharacterized protein YhbP (UPF0306 family)